MDLNDEELIRRIVEDGDQRAYAQLVRRYQSQLRFSLRQLCDGDQGLADDMAQEAFIKAYKALPAFRGDARFSTWLYRIAYNLVMSHKRKNAPEVNQELVDRAQAEESVEESQQLGMARDLHSAMEELSEAQRQAVHLCMQRGFSHEEAASIMKLPLGTVKSHVNRARAKLQSLLQAWREEVVSG
ncbi:RNA polymerase subunit sigma-24 [Microbulbifer flavimaris]|uniref:RNA polymerase subunit sigma-24 n=1 Tax=Microbulbifer flavimaris TaxID=1781068 RepID=A0ABX4I4E1_9GAMM|nr:MULTISPECIES: sigma-70 family RNA polymerase sigma factor [Microbulbifer]KUJ84560.1 RNA polymerase subunit sigma-24 [Microbulbifer sp. ZGT114]PCO06648.1 RNA polymerase subunit sigma-24 [Microbulbifer flavimaris]